MSRELVLLNWWEKYVDVAFLIGAGIVAVAVSGFVPRIGPRIAVTGIGVGLVGTGVWFLLKKE